MIKSYIAFIDETGTLTKDPQQPYFGLGIIYIKDTAALYNDLVLIKDQITTYFHNREPFKEFKFALVNDQNLNFYKKLLDIYKIYTKNGQLGFEAIIIDKLSASNISSEIFTDTWKSYIHYSKQLINQLEINSQNKYICLLSDYFSKPKESTLFYETCLLQEERIIQCCMLESHSSLLIQLVDIILGCIVYKKKYNLLAKNQLTSKLKLVKYLEELLNINDLSTIQKLEDLNFKVVYLP